MLHACTDNQTGTIDPTSNGCAQSNDRSLSTHVVLNVDLCLQELCEQKKICTKNGLLEVSQKSMAPYHHKIHIPIVQKGMWFSARFLGCAANCILSYSSVFFFYTDNCDAFY